MTAICCADLKTEGVKVMAKIYGLKQHQPERKEIVIPPFDPNMEMPGPPGPGGPGGGMGGPPLPAGYMSAEPGTCAAIYVQNGSISKEKSRLNAVYTGIPEPRHIRNVSIVSYDGQVGGIFVEGPAAVEITDTAVSLSGDSTVLGGPDSGVAVVEHGDLTIRDSVIETSGRCRSATIAEQYSTLRVYNSYLSSHGIPYGEGIEKPVGFMATPPGALEIDGNTRTHCTLSNSRSFFYDSTIVADGWAALSTDGAEGYVYLEANRCRIFTTKRGYGAYSDSECHVYFHDCHLNVADMAAIVAGNSDMTFTETRANCGTYFALLHSIGRQDEVSDLTVENCKVHTEKEAFLIKSCNTVVTLRNSDIQSESEVLIRTVINDDEKAVKYPDKDVYGIHIELADMTVNGAVLHQDAGREMWLNLSSTILKGAVQNAILSMDAGSFWYATADSSVVLQSDILTAQIDAPKGVTVHAIGIKAEKVTLASGGMLVITTR